jgi:riboflavin kinase/FMN adenylyltransferase
MKLPVKLAGTVIAYKGNGRRLGYPTANVAAQTDLADGVYFGYADMGRYLHHPSLIFVGIPTTLGDTERRIETHLLDISDKDYYGMPIELSIEYFHRPNQTFASVQKLLRVMKTDESAARQWFKLR